MSKSIQEMQEEVRVYCADKGWDTLTFGECIALLHSEVSEALEAWRRWGLKDATMPKTYYVAGEFPKPEGVGSEFADVFIRLLDDCERFGVDLEAEYERKMAYNRVRPYRHGGKPI
jgi:NTP pyrophosphatase (non-canonical NTP hydrolase)